MISYIFMLFACAKQGQLQNFSVIHKERHDFDVTCVYDMYNRWSKVNMKTEDCKASEVHGGMIFTDGSHKHTKLYKKDNCQWSVDLLLRKQSCGTIDLVAVSAFYKETK